MHGDTIFALSSGRPPAAIGVIRISGPRAGAVIEALSGPLPPPRQAVLRKLRDGSGAMLDQALVLWFDGARTATGEPLAELHLHGGRATVEAVERAIATLPGLRPAEPGEFTRRALGNGRIDLTQAEGLADLLAAETESQRRAALMSAEGAVARAIGAWRERAVDIAALVEAELDFDDEGDVVVGAGEVAHAIAALVGDIAAVLAAPAVERLHHGAAVVLAGPPNSGKSSLFNALVERDAAIVTPVAGTTRDLIEVAVKRNGAIYRLIDTAGVRETGDVVEAIGVERARQSMAAADLVLWLGDEPPAQDDWAWLNPRCDLVDRETARDRFPVSVHRPDTIAALWAQIETGVGASYTIGDHPWLNQRQRAGTLEALDHLEQAQQEPDPLIVAEQLRLTITAFDRTQGKSENRSVLDAVFSRFCIGK